jgi:hypothetical protein
MVAPLLTAFLSLLPLVQPGAAANYGLIKEYAGQNFFNDWTFYDHCKFSIRTRPYYQDLGAPVDDNLTNGDAMLVGNYTPKHSNIETET